MALFSNFDSDYMGGDRFKDIMEKGGNVDVQSLKDFMKDSVEAMASEEDGSVHYKNFGNGLAVVLAWEPGFDVNDPNSLVDSNGYGICASVREFESSYMVEDWKLIGESISITQKDVDEGFENVAQILYDQVVEADPEEVDDGLQDRESTIFDSMEDFKGSFEKWQDAINSDVDKNTGNPLLKVVDLSLGKHQARNGVVLDCVYFTVEEELVDADVMEIDEYLTQLMPQEIIDWLEKDDKDFDYDLEGSNKIAFMVW